MPRKGAPLDLNSKVFRLINQGWSEEEIIKATHLSLRKVKFLLDLHRRDSLLTERRIATMTRSNIPACESAEVSCPSNKSSISMYPCDTASSESGNSISTSSSNTPKKADIPRIKSNETKELMTVQQFDECIEKAVKYLKQIHLIDKTVPLDDIRFVVHLKGKDFH